MTQIPGAWKEHIETNAGFSFASVALRWSMCMTETVKSDVSVYPSCPLSLCVPASLLFVLPNCDEFRKEAMLQ